MISAYGDADPVATALVRGIATGVTSNGQGVTTGPTLTLYGAHPYASPVNSHSIWNGVRTRAWDRYRDVHADGNGDLTGMLGVNLSIFGPTAILSAG